MEKENGRRIIIKFSQPLLNPEPEATFPDLSEYIQSGLLRQFDGIDNVADGHEIKPAIWKDHSSNGIDGVVTSGYAGEKYLFFGGKDSWVNLGQINIPIGTLEVLVWFYTVGGSHSEANYVVSNSQSGGWGIHQKNAKNCVSANIDGSWYYAYGSPCKTNVPICLQATYDGSNLRFYEDGTIVSTVSANGTIKNPNYSTVMAVGSNPYQATQGSSPLTGRVYCVRIYDRVLSDEELAYNYALDKKRFIDNVVSIAKPEGFTIEIPVYDMVPGGALYTKELRVDSVQYAASDTEQSLITLVLPEGNQNTIQNTVGDVTVRYSGGDLYGEGGSVEAFVKQFTPEGLAYKGHQHKIEHIDMVSIEATFTPMKIYYKKPQAPEHLDVEISASVTLIHVDDL